MFIATLFIIAKISKQPKYPSTDDKDIVYTHTHTHTHTHTVEYYSAIEKNEITPFAATWMELEMVIVRKVRKKNTI